jgi:hypothetical protein
MDLVWVTSANYIRDYKIELTFNNGITGIVDLKDNINSNLFKPLKNKDYFKKFTLDSWTLTWDDKLDFSPEYLYELAIENNEKPIPKAHEQFGVSK